MKSKMGLARRHRSYLAMKGVGSADLGGRVFLPYTPGPHLSRFSRFACLVLAWAPNPGGPGPKPLEAPAPSPGPRGPESPGPKPLTLPRHQPIFARIAS